MRSCRQWAAAGYPCSARGAHACQRNYGSRKPLGARWGAEGGRKGTRSRSSPPTCRTRRKSSQSWFPRWRSSRQGRLGSTAARLQSQPALAVLRDAAPWRRNGRAAARGRRCRAHRPGGGRGPDCQRRTPSQPLRPHTAGRVEQANVSYRKEARHSGRSGWTLRKKLRLALDSLTGFDHALVRGMTYFGLLVAVASFALALYVVANAMSGEPPTGWSSIMVAILILGGGQVIFLGVPAKTTWPRWTRHAAVFFMSSNIDDEIASVASPAAARH